MPADASDVTELEYWHCHQGQHYGLLVTIVNLGDNDDSLRGVHGITPAGFEVASVQRLREALEKKSRKYGDLQMPYIIAVSSEPGFYVFTRHEYETLFGDRLWDTPRNYPFEVLGPQKPDGFFTTVREGARRHKHVSAVLVYRMKWIDDMPRHNFHIYHNPYALRPLDPDLFPSIPQYVIQGAELKWINGVPERY